MDKGLEMNILDVIGRKNRLFENDLAICGHFLIDYLSEKRVLIIGAAGTIGHAVAKEVFRRNAKSLHLVDISENNLVEVVRDIRSEEGYTVHDFKTFVCDAGSEDFEFLINVHGPYDLVFNFSALKHVRSEKDIFSLTRMINVNIVNSLKINDLCMQMGTGKYFCVSTDKAANPVNLMGASKLIMEKLLLSTDNFSNITFARFANVAFSDGSLLHGFKQRIFSNQPISAPTDTKRYFITPQEAAILCLFSAVYGKDGEIFIPSAECGLELTPFTEIATRFIRSLGYEPHICDTEIEAREFFNSSKHGKYWPCYFFESDTTGEKAFEEFFTATEVLEKTKFHELWIIKKGRESELINHDFINQFDTLVNSRSHHKASFIELFESILPHFHHEDKGKNLDDRM